MRLARRAFNRLLTLGSLALAGCRSRDEPAPADAGKPASRAGALRYLALGDSYTIGEGVAPAERWPVQLAARLRDAGLDVAHPEIIARTGWRTDDLDAAITRADPQGPYALVSC
jgi:lysophospholipase L1-like esterase